MPPKRTRLDRRPSILEYPSFKAPDADLVQHPKAREVAGTEGTILSFHRSGLTTSKPTQPSVQQPHHDENFIKLKLKPPTQKNPRPIVTKIQPLPTSSSTTPHGTSQPLKQKPTIFLETKTVETHGHSPSREPPSDPTQAPQYRRPLPPSKIHHLKTAYEPFQTPIEQPTGQPRLSRAIKFHLTHLTIQENQTLLSELPFSQENDLEATQTSWVTHRHLRDARLRRIDPISPRELHSHTHSRNPPHITTTKTPTLLRHGPKNSNIPILVRWTSPSGPDTYALYHEREPMPRQIRFLLFEAVGWPFGREGEEWDVGTEGRVWIRDRRVVEGWGRWWKLE